MKLKLLQHIIPLILILSILTSLLAFIPAGAEEPSKIISFTSPAIPCNAGDTINLSNYAVQFTRNGEPKTNAEWSSSELSVSSGMVTPTEKGVYTLCAKSGNSIKNIYLVVKNPSDSEYVLYENKFENANDLTEITKSSGTSWSAVDGKLTMDASQASSKTIFLAMPSWLADFGDYQVSVNMSMLKAVNEKRWASVVFRLQNNKSLYYQMAVRSNATLSNGIEIAEHISSGWNVTHTAAYSEQLSAAKTYKMEVKAKGNTAAIFINGTPINISESVTTHATGKLGLQVNSCKAVFSDYKVTLALDDIKFEIPTEYTEVNVAKTGITVAPAVVTYGTSDYKALSESGASSAIYNVNSDLSLAEGGTVESAVKGLDLKVIPIFKVQSSSTATALANELKRLDFSDAFVMSSDPNVILSARKTYNTLYGALDFSGSTEKLTLSQMREQANKAMCRVIVVSDSNASRADVEALQEMFASVWVVAKDGIAGHAAAVTSGAQGIITKDTAGLLSFMKEYFPENSVVRTVQIIAHRGVPPLAQENSIEGSKMAYSFGATMIENDVYITTDGIVVVMHDSTIDRTTNGSGNVESMTYEQLSQYVLDGTTTLPTQPIPTLEDYFKEFKGKDVKIVIEIKSTNSRLVPAIKKLIDEYDILDQVNFITFHVSQISALRQYIPEAPCGYLISSLSLTDSDSTNSAQKVLELVQPYGATYNPSYKKGLGNETMQSLTYRGVTVWPYTVNDKADFTKMFLVGLSGITTNYSNWVKDTLKTVSVPSKLSFKLGESAQVTVSGKTYGRADVTLLGSEYIFLSGNSTLSYENGIFTATESGSAVVMFRHLSKLPDGTKFYLYTEPMTISVTEDVIEETTTEAEVTVAPTTSADADKSNGCGGISILSTIFAICCAVFVTSVKKRIN